MKERFQFFAKKVTFNLVVVTVLAGFFHLGQLHTSTSGYDYDEEYQRRVSRSLPSDSFLDGIVDPVGREGAVAPVPDPYQGWDVNNQEYQDFLSLEPLVLPPGKASGEQALGEEGSLVGHLSTTFPDLSTVRSASSSDRSYNNIPRPPSLFPEQRNNIAKQDALFARAISFPLIKKFSNVGIALDPDIDSKAPLADQKNQKGEKRVSFVSSPDVGFLSEEFKGCRNRNKERLSQARQLDDNLAQSNPDDKK
ncbi:MAG: hypothetical protein NTU89_00400 [Candidatus Dependentiae bacterium]|nr:hypothetical protein [Candidatus Dependentiae bacterium]